MKIGCSGFLQPDPIFSGKKQQNTCFQSYMTYKATIIKNHLSTLVGSRLCFHTSIGWTFRMAASLIFSNSCQLQCFCQILGQRWPERWRLHDLVKVKSFSKYGDIEISLRIYLYIIYYILYIIYVYLFNVHIYNYICNMYVYVDYAYSHIWHIYIYICLSEYAIYI